ncbi:hypothetical protein MHI48_22185 [Paenibacillus sp. FSL H7-0942]|uniref:hypothetical protein n=1 Tax=Paenibacillus TaxID=44249 RepID=UPI00096FFDB9|nr:MULTISPECIES: hypothetical protein [Paenibacillus]MCP1422329.1 hypothetical protein [Paenibacillus xylanexedens]OME98081.1 hypothetical protein BK124_12645 [Paenibacillus amylolyticus]
MQLKINKSQGHEIGAYEVVTFYKGGLFAFAKKYIKEGYVFWADYYMMSNNILHRREHVQKESGG